MLPERIASKIADPVERRRHLKGGLTLPERVAKNDRRNELAEQREFHNWLLLKRSEGILTFTHPRSDRPTTIEVGHCDFMVRSGGRCISIEFKSYNGALTAAQKEFIQAECLVGNPAGVCFCAGDAIDLIRLWLNDKPLPLSFYAND